MLISSSIKIMDNANLIQFRIQLPKMLEPSRLNKFNSRKWLVMYRFSLKEMLLIRAQFKTTSKIRASSATRNEL